MPVDYNREPDFTPETELLRQAGIGPGIFRCDRCDRAIPEKYLVVQDGVRLCKTLCADPTSPSEQTAEVAGYFGKADSYEQSTYPTVGATSGAVCVTGWSPARPVSIERGGAAVTITFTGVNFVTPFTVTYDDAVYIVSTAGPTVVNSTTATVQVDVAAAAAGGRHAMTVLGTTYRDAINATGNPAVP